MVREKNIARGPAHESGETGVGTGSARGQRCVPRRAMRMASIKAAGQKTFPCLRVMPRHSLESYEEPDELARTANRVERARQRGNGRIRPARRLSLPGTDFTIALRQEISKVVLHYLITMNDDAVLRFDDAISGSGSKCQCIAIFRRPSARANIIRAPTTAAMHFCWMHLALHATTPALRND